MIPLSLTNLARRVGRMFGALPSGFPDEWQLLPALTVDANGWLQGAGVEHVEMHPSRRYADLRTPRSEPIAVTWHFSATDAGTARSMADRLAKPRAPTDREVSWHISIETYGGIIQQAPLTVGCWHAGSDTAIPIKGAGWANRVAASIELIGWGRAFPKAQVRDAARVLAAIVDRYNIKRSLASVTHEELDRGRKNDPGPVWKKHHRHEVEEYAYAR